MDSFHTASNDDRHSRMTAGSAVPSLPVARPSPEYNVQQLDHRPVCVADLQMDGIQTEADQQFLELLIRYRRHGPPA
jgi:hypothetical protein